AETTEQHIALNIRIAQVAGTHLGDTEMAIQSLQEVLAAQPDNRNALSVLANLYFQQGDYGRALELLNDMLAYAQNGAEQAAVLVRVARIMQQPGGDERQAEDALVQALQADPSNVDAIDSLLEIYEGRGEHESRLRVMEYKIATVEDPEERFAMLVDLANAAKTKLKDFDTAVRTLEQAYAMKADDLDVAEQLLDAYIHSGDTAKAEPLLAGIIEQLEGSRQNKKLPPFHHLRGQLAMRAGNEDEALASFQAAYDIDATYLPNLLDLGKFHYRNENMQEAMKIFQTMLLHQMNIKDDDMKVDIFYHLGMVRWRTD